MSGLFIQSAVIVLREGLEALLVIASMAAYLAKLGAQRKIVMLYGGAALAVAASIVSAMMIERLGPGSAGQTIQGIAVLIAAAVMLLISGWLFLGRRGTAWQTYMSRSMDYAASRQTGWAIFGLSFLVVYREGAEIVVFILALTRGTAGMTFELIAGLATGAAMLVLLFLAIQVVTRRTTLRFAFLVTSFLFFLMAIKFIGDGIEILQSEAVITRTPINGGDWLGLLGFNPSWEAVVVQLAIVLVTISGCVTMAYGRRNEHLV